MSERCTVCNWAPHDVSIHGKTCSKGHPLVLVGQTANGSCKRCRADRAMGYYRERQEAENERSRAYHAAHRAAIIERKRARRGYRAIVGQRRGHRGAEGAAPAPDHKWRASHASPEAMSERQPAPSTGERSVAGPGSEGRPAVSFAATTKGGTK